MIARIGGFERGLDQAERKSKRTADQIARDQQKRAEETRKAWEAVGTGIGVAFTAASAATVAALHSTINAGVEIERLSALVGSGNNEFQRYAAGARKVGIEQEKLADIFKDVQDKVGDFAQTGGGALKDFFEQIAPRVGVTAEQFRKLSGPDALQLYVSSLEKANLSQADMVFYMEAIASDATRLLPLLRDNGKGFLEAGDQAERYGAILNEDVIDASIRFREEMNKLSMVIDGLELRIGGPIISSVVKFIDRLEAARKEGLSTWQALTRIYSENVMDFYGTSRYSELAKELDTVKKSLDGQLLSEQQRERFAARRVELEKELAGILNSKAGAGRGVVNPQLVRPAPSFSDRVDPNAGKGAQRAAEQAAKEAQAYLENLQKQLQATESLSVAETVLRDIQSGRLKLAGGVTEAELVGVAKQIDAANALTKSLDDRKKAMEAIDQMQAAMDSKALAEVDALIQGNEALRNEIDLIGLEGTARLKVEQARLDSTIALKDEELQMLKNAGASATQISALEREIVLLRQRSELLGKKAKVSAAVEEVKKLDDFAKNAAQNIQGYLGSSFADILNGEFDNIGDSFVKMLNRMIAEAAAAQLARHLFGGMVSGGQGSGAVGDIFGTFMNWITGASGKANGGGVMAGGLYEVNENGPEMLAMGGKQYLMMGNQGGTVIPAGDGSMAAGTGGGVTVNVINQGGGSLSVTGQSQRRDANGGLTIDVMVEAIQGMLADNVANGSGSLSRAMEGRYGLRTSVS